MTPNTCPITGHPLTANNKIHPTLTTEITRNLQQIKELYPHALEAIGSLTRPNPPSETHSTTHTNPIRYQLIEDLQFDEKEILEIAHHLTHTTPKNLNHAINLIHPPKLITHPNAPQYYWRIKHTRERLEETLKPQHKRNYTTEYARRRHQQMPLKIAVLLHNATQPRRIEERTIRTMRQRKLIPQTPNAMITPHELKQALQLVRPRQTRGNTENT